METSKTNFSWVEFYSEFATKLLGYKHNRASLVAKIIAIFDHIGKKMPTLEKDNALVDIDPFTVFALFNKGITNDNRIEILTEVAKLFSIQAPVPYNFEGIPIVNNQSATFYDFIDKRGAEDIDNIWSVFVAALDYAESQTSATRMVLTNSFDTATQMKGIKWNLTICLYWVRPDCFINLDSCNRKFLADNALITKDLLKELPNGEQYLSMCDSILGALKEGLYSYNSFPELSYQAWLTQSKDKSIEKSKTMTIVDTALPDNMDAKKSSSTNYTAQDFLNEVFLDIGKYHTLVGLLNNKKNIILQGAPGVGKTFAAKRLAYSMMGEQDDSRIEFVQFHQNYSYEDFMMGYKPNKDGFELKYGVFHRFCQKAANQPNKDHFFIIDEINRGNMSKIFGELLMLIERDYRGSKATLAYNGLSFSVPTNLYIIGMMNTADRSLAMIDYALRRRFSFFEMTPAFDSEGFIQYQNKLNNEKLSQVISKIKELNEVIAKDGSLGKGFCIGHSYFCNQAECNEDWLRSVVEYEILPMLSEYWFDDAAKLEAWENNLRGVFQ